MNDHAPAERTPPERVEYRGALVQAANRAKARGVSVHDLIVDLHDLAGFLESNPGAADVIPGEEQ